MKESLKNKLVLIWLLAITGVVSYLLIVTVKVPSGYEVRCFDQKLPTMLGVDGKFVTDTINAVGFYPKTIKGKFNMVETPQKQQSNIQIPKIEPKSAPKELVKSEEQNNDSQSS